MTTVLEMCTTEEQCSFVLFLCFHKEMFPVYGGKCLLRKTIHVWAKKRGKHFAVGEVQTEVRKWLRQSEDFYAAGFDAQVKRLDRCIMLMEDMSRNNFFSPGSNITVCFYVLYPFVAYLLSVPPVRYQQVKP
jgi:hypothetical protein